MLIGDIFIEDFIEIEDYYGMVLMAPDKETGIPKSFIADHKFSWKVFGHFFALGWKRGKKRFEMAGYHLSKAGK